MRITKTALAEVFLFHPTVFEDDRGCFYESFNSKMFEELVGRKLQFVQDNHSVSRKFVLRGLHYQVGRPQGKLVRVVSGEVIDVAVDLRRSSSTFGNWVSMKLSALNRAIAWIPEGFAHGFLVTSESAEFLYKTTDYWVPEYERTLHWQDPTIGIDWQVDNPILSRKDQAGLFLQKADVFE